MKTSRMGLRLGFATMQDLVLNHLTSVRAL